MRAEVLAAPEPRAAIHVQLLHEADRNRRNTQIAAWAIRIALLAVVLSLWEAAARTNVISVINMSHPAGIARYLLDLLPTGDIWPHLLATTSAAIAGFLLGSLSGILAGVLLDRAPLLSRAVDPYVIVLNSMPRPALAPIFLLWFGLGAVPKVLISASIVFFVLLLTTRAGLQTVDRDILLMTRVLGMNSRQEFLKVRLISATPAMIAGLRLAAVYSVLGVVVTEMVASQQGLGQLIVFETGRFNTDGAFAVILLLALIATSFDALISVIQRRVTWTSQA